MTRGKSGSRKDATPTVDTGAGEQGAVDSTSIGSAIRSRRKLLGLTLVQLARSSNLSQPFLSQIERGQASPSMRSLNRLAAALETTGPRLLAWSAAGPMHLSRRDDISSVNNDVGLSVSGVGGTTRSLAGGDGSIAVTEYEGGMVEFSEFFQHQAREVIYVVSGEIEIEVGERSPVRLRERESVAIDGGMRHRWRMFKSEPPPVVLLITQSERES